MQWHLGEKEIFKLVDALETTMRFYDLGNFPFHMPVHNTYIPVRNTIMKKPNLLDEDIEDDELGYQYQKEDHETTRRRISMMSQLSPLRPNRMGPGLRRLPPRYIDKKDFPHRGLEPVFSKWRRLSKIHNRSFSTMVEQPQ